MRRYSCTLTRALRAASVLLLLTACGQAAQEAEKSGATDTSTVGTVPGDSSTATVTKTVTATQTETATRIETATVTETAVITATATNVTTNTVTKTESITATITTTATETITQSSTKTETETKTQTVTNIGTVTATVTVTKAETSLAKGTYDSQLCYLDNLSSIAAGQKIYARTSFRFDEHNSGDNSYSLYGDAGCSRKISGDKLNITYSVDTYFDRLLLIGIEQYRDSKNKQPVGRFWIPALALNNDLLLDVDSERGAHGPYLSIPNENELRVTLEGMEQRAVLFQKK